MGARRSKCTNQIKKIDWCHLYLDGENLSINNYIYNLGTTMINPHVCIFQFLIIAFQFWIIVFLLWIIIFQFWIIVFYFWITKFHFWTIVFHFWTIVFQFWIVMYWNQTDAANVTRIVQQFRIPCALCMSWFVRHESLIAIDGTISTAGFTMAHVWRTPLLLTIIDSLIFLESKTRKPAITWIHVSWKFISN